MRKPIRFFALLLACLLLGPCALAADGTAYNSYTFSGWNEIIPAPNGYVPKAVYNGVQLGANAFLKPSDLFVDKAREELYIADTGNKRIVVLNKDLQFMREYATLLGGELISPKGLFVNQNGDIYVADDGAAQVIAFHRNGRVFAAYGRPQSDLYEESMMYLPQKVVVDSVGRVYILSQGVYQGLICLNPDGTFLNFYGGNHVEATFKMALQKLWRLVLTRAQRAGLESFIPIEYSNIAIDEEDFIYATVAVGDQAAGKFLRKLNPMGINILPNMTIGGLQMVDVALSGNGLLTVLDKSMGLAIQMDEDGGGNMYNFGGLGTQTGLYKDPAAIVAFGNDMLILDREKGTVSVFELTDFGRAVQAATRLYREGLYEQSIEPWLEVLRMDANYNMAYAGLGKAYYQLEQYQTAMHYYELGNFKEHYSQAFRAYTVEVVRRYLGHAIGLIILSYAGLKIYQRARRNRPKKKRSLAQSEWTYPLYCALHPYQGFDDLKYFGRGSTASGFVILCLFFLSLVIKRQGTGFIFNTNQPEKLNVPLMFLVSMGGFAVWYVSSLAVSSLMKDCEGKNKELFLAACYALVPVIVGTLFATAVSNFITLDMKPFLDMFNMVMYIWAGVVLFMGISQVNRILFKQTILNIVLTVAAMMVVLCLCVLAFSLFQQLYVFAMTLYSEIIFRL